MQFQKTAANFFKKITNATKNFKDPFSGGPVYFLNKEIDQIFYVLRVSEDGGIAELIYDSELPSTKGREYILPDKTPTLSPGETYELKKKEDEFYLKRVAVMINCA
jgi:hypothetical protein